jgi:hypothetical protein
MLINYHAKNEKQGWHLVCSFPIDSDQWGKTDRSFIDEMLKQGHQVITCGWNMWEIAPDGLTQEQHQEPTSTAPRKPTRQPQQTALDLN